MHNHSRQASNQFRVLHLLTVCFLHRRHELAELRHRRQNLAVVLSTVPPLGMDIDVLASRSSACFAPTHARC